MIDYIRDLTVFGRVFWLVVCLLWLVCYIGRVLMYTKIGYAWYETICPVYRFTKQFYLAGFSQFWVLMTLVPILNCSYLVMHYWSMFRVFKCLGMTTGKSVLATMFPCVFFFVVAFSDDYEYEALYW